MTLFDLAQKYTDLVRLEKEIPAEEHHTNGVGVCPGDAVAGTDPMGVFGLSFSPPMSLEGRLRRKSRSAVIPAKAGI